MDLCFIINPAAGKGMTSKSIPIIEKFCREQGVSYNIRITKYQCEATSITQECISKKPSAIVAVGGDGTVLETANGLIGSTIPLGIIPLGSGNDFARSLNIPIGFNNVENALHAIIKGTPRSVDVGSIGNTFFLNVASVGFDAEIIRDLSKIKRYIKGKVSYPVSVFLKFLTYRKKHVIITIDGKEIETDLFLAAICNGTCYGGGMKVNPHGLIDDGYFNLILVKPVPRFLIPFLLSKFIKGEHLELPYVSTYLCKNVSIISKDNLVVNADGDLVATTPINFSLLPLSIKLLTEVK